MVIGIVAIKEGSIPSSYFVCGRGGHQGYMKHIYAPLATCDIQWHSAALGSGNACHIAPAHRTWPLKLPANEVHLPIIVFCL
jgi:hypothetical protein